MYTDRNFRTKKDLKAAVAAAVAGTGPAVTYYQPGPFGGHEPTDGVVYCEGPHYPAAHTWYASCKVEGGKIVKVS
jgi:hypothetical protein